MAAGISSRSHFLKNLVQILRAFDPQCPQVDLLVLFGLSTVLLDLLADLDVLGRAWELIQPPRHPRIPLCIHNPTTNGVELAALVLIQIVDDYALDKL